MPDDVKKETPAEGTQEHADKEPHFEGDFDPERAKKAITNLREEVASLKERVTSLTAERDEFRSAAEKTGTERDEALAAAVKRAEDAERALAIKEHNLPDDVVEEFADYLTGTPEEVKARAARLAARLAPPKADDEHEADEADQGDQADEADKPAPPSRPQPRLVPGHDTEPAPEFDPVAIAREARKRNH